MILCEKKITNDYFSAAKSVIALCLAFVFTMIGTGYYVDNNRGVGFLTLLGRALNLERKESGELLSDMLRPKGARKIIDILVKLAAIDDDIAQEEIDLIEKMYFEAYRLGEVATNIAVAEPVFRDADLVSIDMNSVKSSDSGNFAEFIPNGFNGKEICSLTRYAGISDKVSAFGIFNFNTVSQEEILIAQMVWYFVEGFSFRSNEYPFGSKEKFIKLNR